MQLLELPEMWNVVAGEESAGSIVAGSEIAKSALKINSALIEQIEVREGDTYTICDAAGDPVSTTVQQDPPEPEVQQQA